MCVCVFGSEIAVETFVWRGGGAYFRLMGLETDCGWKLFLLGGQWQSEVQGQATPARCDDSFLSFVLLFSLSFLFFHSKWDYRRHYTFHCRFK